jgi:hypothetical protein
MVKARTAERETLLRANVTAPPAPRLKHPNPDETPRREPSTVPKNARKLANKPLGFSACSNFDLLSLEMDRHVALPRATLIARRVNIQTIWTRTMSHPKTKAASMLLRYRSAYFLVTFTLLATPLIVGLVRPDSPELVYNEGRGLEPWPGMPAGLAQLSAFPAQMNAYLNDHFSLRHAMIKLHEYLYYPVLMGSRDALIGRGGRFFYQRNEMIRQSAGIVFRDQRIVEAVSFLTSIRNKLAERGARLLVAIPPNSATIYQDELPYWAQSRGRKTEYDLFLESLAARGIKTVDLRPTMKAVRKDGDPI